MLRQTDPLAIELGQRRLEAIEMARQWNHEAIRLGELAWGVLRCAGLAETRTDELGGKTAMTVTAPDFVEELSARFHDIYQKEAHRRGDVRHADRYEELSEETKEWDRVLARWVLMNFVPRFNWTEGVPGA